MAEITRPMWKVLAAAPILASRPMPFPYRFTDVNKNEVSEAMVVKLVDKGFLRGKILQPGVLSPDIQYVVTAEGQDAYALGDKKFNRKKVKGAG